ncbi:hypothetical protein P0Y43_01160 [Pseudomonas entomophila]|uniref:hypothetical protein n=1 Tax=Pseudomonas entomophila TaxID=312306 RepID=UPI0023D85F53|nr:hypothetical protein [Pseudomonas entomophila]MDF0729332.1 hypothetical protein [Pseudomonas entomophila]
MSRHPELQQFLNRYFTVFLSAYFLSIYAAAGTFSLVWSTYCRVCARENTYPLSLAVVVLAFVTAHAAVVRGRRWGTWGVALICIGCVLMVLPTYGYRPHLFVYASVLLTALLALLVLNSQRYREMCERLAHYRRQRNVERAAKAKR